MITRRLFSFGALAAPLVVRTPGLLMPLARPILWSDGVHCDADWVEHELRRTGVVEGRRLFVARPVFPPAGRASLIKDCVLTQTRFEIEAVFDPAMDLNIGRCVFNYWKESKA